MKLSTRVAWHYKKDGISNGRNWTIATPKKPDKLRYNFVSEV